ncbi:MAG: response regulator [Clostridiales bacterium]|jgi:two-component system response regulator YesN|nr:response regulator [Clostridiales bacterium]
MIGVLVVDDESITRNFLKKIIPKLNKNCEVLGTAADGHEALAFLETTRVDLVITDIKMPVMTGLELCMIINERFADTLVVILSGYDEFNFACEAMRYNVKDYLLKPIVNKDLEKVLACAENLIVKSRKDKQRMLLNQEQAGQTSDLLTSLFFKSRVMGNREDAAFYQERMSATHIAHPNGTVLYIDVKLPREAIQNTNDTEVFALRQISAISKTEFSGYTFNDSDHNAITLFSHITQKDSGSAVSRFYKRLTDIWQPNWGPLSITAAWEREIDNLNQTAITCESLALLRGIKPIIHYSDEYRGQRDELTLYAGVAVKNATLHACEQLSKAFVYFSQQTSSAAEGEITERELATRVLYKDIFRDISACFDLLTPTDRVILFKNIILYHNNVVMDDEIDKIFTAPEWETENEVPAYLLNKAVNRLIHQNDDGISGNARTVKSAVEYIVNNFHKPISLTMVADAIGVSTSYLSNIFSKETKKSYSKFLVDLRMRAAARYLSEDNAIHLSDVAERTGFVNSKHFFKVFKGYYGVTPTEYKIRHRAQR